MKDADEPQAECLSCDIVEQYINLSNEFTQNLSEGLLGPMWGLFIALAGLWVVIQGIRLTVAHTTWADIVKEFLFVAIAAVLLTGQSRGLVDTVFNASLATMGSAASVALAVGGGVELKSDPDACCQPDYLTGYFPIYVVMGGHRFPRLRHR